MMPEVQVQEVVEALTEGLSQGELADIVRRRPHVAPDVAIAGEPVSHAASDLLIWAVRQNQEVALVHAAYRANPLNPKIRHIYQKYGMAPQAAVQHAGAPIPNPPDSVMADGFEKIVNYLVPRLDLIAWRKMICRVEGWVCRVRLDQDPVGTGFLVGPDTLLTNYHVLRPAIEGRVPWSVVSCQFDCKTLTDGSRLDGTEVRLAAEDCLIDACPCSPAERKGRLEGTLPTPDELDFAVVRLERRVGLERVDPQGRSQAPPRGWIPVPAQSPVLQPKDPLLIVQYPYGKPLTLALDMQAVIGHNANGTRVRYATRTDPAASGSPCFSLDWTLVALHHYGDPLFGHPSHSQGVPIGMIRDRLARRGKTDALGGTTP